MSLLAEVCAALDQGDVPHAVIGATALAIHGVPRATSDLDLLAMGAPCLAPATWDRLRFSGHVVEIRAGDENDPLAGVVRISSRAETTIDVVVGRHAWQREILERAERARIDDASVPVVRPADLVLLKLYAGGPQDAWDVDQLLDVKPNVVGEVERRLVALPEDCSIAWRRILQHRDA